jgi:predicted alpha/beta-fold hydrolase
MRFTLVWGLLLGFTAAVSNAVAEEVQFETTDGVVIRGSYFPPSSGPSAAIVLLHMLRKNRESWSEFAQFAQSKGYAVLTIDFRGHGQSLQTKTKPFHEADFSDADYALMKLDVAAAVEWLRKRPEIESDKIALVGASIGANVALIQAAEDSLLMGVVLLSPGEVYRGISVRPALAVVKAVPICMIAAEDDNYSAITVMNLSQMDTMKTKMKLYQEGGHGTYLLESHPEVMDYIVEYLDALRNNHTR